MKKIFLLLILLFVFTESNAQSPIIVQFREIIKDAPNQFSNYQKNILVENKEKQNILYDSKIEDTSISRNFISRTENKSGVYIIKFEVSKLEGLYLKIFMQISGQYITELNDMIKSGNYTGSDYKDNDDNITEVKDLKGNVVAKYVSNLEDHFIIVMGNPVN